LLLLGLRSDRRLVLLWGLRRRWSLLWRKPPRLLRPPLRLLLAMGRRRRIPGATQPP
jgi:hypothetical protein